MPRRGKEMNRPWTKGPWEVEGRSIYALRDIGYGANKINSMYAQFQHCRGGADDKENEANANLASKAPEMAELLIDLIEGNIGPDGLYDLVLDAVHLLKE